MSPDEIKAAYIQAKEMALENCIYERDRLKKVVERLTVALGKISELQCVSGQAPCKDKTCARCIATKALQA